MPTNDGQVREDGTFVVKYTARTSGAPKAGDGARIEAGSAGGYGRDEWKILVGGDYALEFESSIVSREPVYAASSTARGSVRLTGSTKPYKLKPDGKLYRLYDGDGDVAFQTQSLRSDPCDPLIAGSGTSKLSVVDTFIQITPPQQVNGAQVAGRAEVVLAYSFSMGAGETETVATMVNYQCVPGDVHQVPFWWSNYLAGRGADGDVNFLRNWDYVGRDGVVARKTLRGNCGGMCSQETSVFTLRKVEPR